MCLRGSFLRVIGQVCTRAAQDVETSDKDDPDDILRSSELNIHSQSVESESVLLREAEFLSRLGDPSRYPGPIRLYPEAHLPVLRQRLDDQECLRLGEGQQLVTTCYLNYLP